MLKNYAVENEDKKPPSIIFLFDAESRIPEKLLEYLYLVEEHELLSLLSMVEVYSRNKSLPFKSPLRIGEFLYMRHDIHNLLDAENG